MVGSPQDRFEKHRCKAGPQQTLAGNPEDLELPPGPGLNIPDVESHLDEEYS